MKITNVRSLACAVALSLLALSTASRADLCPAGTTAKAAATIGCELACPPGTSPKSAKGLGCVLTCPPGTNAASAKRLDCTVLAPAKPSVTRPAAKVNDETAVRAESDRKVCDQGPLLPARPEAKTQLKKVRTKSANVVKGLSEAELLALIDYTAGGYQAMNGILRGTLLGASCENKWTQQIALASAAMTKLPTAGKKGEKLSRTTGWKGFLETFATLKKGGNFSDRGFLSTKRAGGKVVLPDTMTVTFEITSGAEFARSVKDLASKPEESELIFPPRQKFKISQIQAVKSGKTTETDNPLKLYPDRDEKEKAFNQPGLTWVVTMAAVP